MTPLTRGRADSAGERCIRGHREKVSKSPRTHLPLCGGSFLTGEHALFSAWVLGQHCQTDDNKEMFSAPEVVPRAWVSLTFTPFTSHKENFLDNKVKKMNDCKSVAFPTRCNLCTPVIFFRTAGLAAAG